MTINIVDDDIYEQTEQFMAVLTTNDSCVEFKQESTLISILDDDCELCSTVFDVKFKSLEYIIVRVAVPCI